MRFTLSTTSALSLIAFLTSGTAAEALAPRDETTELNRNNNHRDDCVPFFFDKSCIKGRCSEIRTNTTVGMAVGMAEMAEMEATVEIREEATGGTTVMAMIMEAVMGAMGGTAATVEIREAATGGTTVMAMIMEAVMGAMGGTAATVEIREEATGRTTVMAMIMEAGMAGMAEMEVTAEMEEATGGTTVMAMVDMGTTTAVEITEAGTTTTNIELSAQHITEEDVQFNLLLFA
ncbi:hypothetical protein DFH09DRAFT_1077115 [Mycena vulgaris]|nr:hypothetical protein DFH09DRAFT_1077115 [Mycena vulgaris]